MQATGGHLDPGRSQEGGGQGIMGEEGEARRLGSGVLQGEGCYGGWNLCSLQTEVALQDVRRLLDLQARQTEV